MRSPINFDANASYGVSAFVAEGLQSVGFDLHNPNAVHRGGQRARALVEEARERVARLLNVGKDSRIVFTSGATESNNTALRIPFHPSISERLSGALVISQIEHPSVLECARLLARRGVELKIVPWEREQGISQQGLLPLLSGNTRLVSLIWVNNETGEVLPIPQIVSALRLQQPHLLIHSDAVQAVGRLQIDFERSGLDMLTISGHKIGGLAGAGALVVGRRVPFEPLLVGGVQELHHRAGTENVLGIVSLGLAAQEISEHFHQRTESMAQMRGLLCQELSKHLPDLTFNTPLERSVPNTINVHIPGVRADDLVVALDRVGMLISSGAACASGKPEPSHVLLAQGLSPEAARESVRISLRADCAAGEVRELARELVSAVNWMRNPRSQVVGA